MIRFIKDLFISCWTFGTNPISLGAAILWDGVKEFYTLANITPQKEVWLGLLFLTCCILAVSWPGFIWLLALAPVAFIQNMFFTLVSRSRNSQDTDYHRYCAWGSNGVWFLCQIMIVKNIWAAINAGQWWYAIMAGIVYSLATTEGSVLMMKRLIATEKGKRRVGANDKIESLEQRVQVLERMIQPRPTQMSIDPLVKPFVMGMGAGVPVDAVSKDEIKVEVDVEAAPFGKITSTTTKV